MIVYNLTIKVMGSIAERWLEWCLQKHIPAILSTGMFDGYRLHRLLDQDESEGPTFVLQLHTTSVERYRSYHARFAPPIRQEALDTWGERFIAFHTVMEVVNPTG